MENSENSCRPCREYWVATDGCDCASGDYRHPFRTIEHARDVIRKDPFRGKGTIYVNIREGVYRFHKPLVLLPEDSGSSEGEVIYRSAKGEQAVISGGMKVIGWTLHDPELNIWKAKVKVETETMPRQLYVNSERATRARSIDYPNYYTPTKTGYVYHYDGGKDPQIPPTWKNPSVVEAVTATQWKMMRCPVSHVIDESDVIMQQPCWDNANTFPFPWNFYLLSWLENAYEFLNEPGEWYLDPTTQILYYIPRPGEDMRTADVELPLLEKLVEGFDVSHVRFERLVFEYATWLGPNTPNGYASDQAGFHLIGTGHEQELIGHAQNVTRTPGNVSFSFSRHITFERNIFTHLGAVALDFGTGSQNNRIVNNIFSDISSAGIQLGGVGQQDHHPDFPREITRDNLISNNLVEHTAVEYYDAAAIFIGFTMRTRVAHNDIQHTSWSGISIGWGWGLRDPGGFAGLGAAVPYQWGIYTTPTTARGNQILHNHIQHFLEKTWDGGAIYCTGFQGTSMDDGLLIKGNVAENKRPFAGGNIFYTDGGSRYVTLTENVAFNNPVGAVDFGPCGKSSSLIGFCLLTGIVPYGSDFGGCLPYGDMLFERNYLGNILSNVDFYSICSSPYFPNYPVNMTFTLNTRVLTRAEIPAIILNSAGRQG